MRRALLLLVLLFILAAPAAALGVSPPSYELEFKPNKTMVGNCDDIINSKGCICVKGEGELNINISTNGDMPELVDLNSIRPYKDMGPWKCYSYNITFPEEAQKAGRNTVRVVASGLAAVGMIQAVINVDQKIYVDVDPKYAADYVPPPLKPFDFNRLMTYASIGIIFLLILFFLRRVQKEEHKGET